MTDLPPLPEKGYLGDDASYGYDEADMRAYAEAAIKQELEAIAADWESDHGFDKDGVAAAIRARSEEGKRE